jgi:hypothetical protein
VQAWDLTCLARPSLCREAVRRVTKQKTGNPGRRRGPASGLKRAGNGPPPSSTPRFYHRGRPCLPVASRSPAPDLSRLAFHPLPVMSLQAVPNRVREVKFDGYRAMIRQDGAGVRLFTRTLRGYVWTDRYPAILSAARSLSCILPPWLSAAAVALSCPIRPTLVL